ncbi:HD family phosphohydrolase [Iningainema sp. BLCCT55]|uniref:HD family phosphohydrolase n=2 Tax=Iningainema TaxID=1932705 RepID=A0A8J7CBC2_9CYAN|nr:HD family phosphohydrolase [Iningainema tapete]MBD2778186.1 HD family phosphohydrolase [Iningainema tapete BLCC-T55]
MVKSVKMKSSIDAVGYLNWLGGKPSPVIFLIAVISLTIVMGHKLYNQPQLRVGTVAPLTIKAPTFAYIQDRKKTEFQRQAASKSSIPILMVDHSINEQVENDLQQFLTTGNEIRKSMGSLPFFDTFIISLSTQRYLRSCSNWEWQAIQIAILDPSHQLGVLTQKQKITIKGLNTPVNKDSSILWWGNPKLVDFVQNADFTQAVFELEAYRLKTSKQNLLSLVQKISLVRQAYAQATAKLSQLVILQSETVYKVYDDTTLLNLSDDDWAKTQIGIEQSTHRILAQGISPGLPSEILQNAVSLQVQTSVPQESETLATKLLLAILKPNLKKDEIQTQLVAAKAASGVKPVMVAVRRGEVIVRQGEKITEWKFEVLEHYHLIRREINWLSLIQLGIVITGAVSIFASVEKRSKRKMRQSDRLLVLLLTLSTPIVLIMGTPYTTWSAIGLLLGSFYGSVLGVTVVVLLSFLLLISIEISKASLLAGVLGGILGSCIAKRLHSREELALLGVAIGLTQGGVYLILQLLLSAAFGYELYIVLPQAAMFALSGLAWSVVALGISPYLEKLFDLVTPIRLAELSNPNRPLLKRLATETPGTFQHTLLVATLAEAAAKTLRCDVELVRAGTLYHDIGKIHDPLAFIENQMGGPNKHDTEINNPWKSAEIIKKHVTEGLVMARKHSLPTAIQAFIPEHQGTMQISYFYHQAEQMAQEDSTIKVEEADFRYDGPIPQSRETAIVMLADSCEAALRSLRDATPEKALVMVNNILRARWQDNQMVDSGLTREEMSQIGEIFVYVWQQFHHKRIAYPKLKPQTEKSANG